jgi:hypothetical protein
MMDGGAANFGATQYTGIYSKSTLDDKLLNFMGEMNKDVPLILHPFHSKCKMLWCIGHLN